MSTLPDITEALCRALARRDLLHARTLARQASAKMGGVRAQRLEREFNAYAETSAFVALDGKAMRHWNQVVEPRSPWVPSAVADAIEAWLAEVSAAPALTEAGERVQPLLLSGETRCGKTSALCAVAMRMGLPVMRLSLADAVDSHLGETAKAMHGAFKEAVSCPPAVWLIDEIDAVAMHRGGRHQAEQERAHSVGSLLTDLDTLPPGFPLVATTNLVENIDRAVRGRFTEVEFARWSDLSASEREAFAVSHGGHSLHAGGTYAETVKACRRARVKAILSKAGSQNGEASP